MSIRKAKKYPIRKKIEAKVHWIWKGDLAKSISRNKKSTWNIMYPWTELMKLDLLLKNIAQDEKTLPSINIEKVCTNSNDVTNESLFIAINGTKNDGHSLFKKQ